MLSCNEVEFIAITNRDEDKNAKSSIIYINGAWIPNQKIKKQSKGNPIPLHILFI